MEYHDSGHRDHAKHFHERPNTRMDYAVDQLKVTLDNWGPRDFMNSIERYLHSNWGEGPMTELDAVNLGATDGNAGPLTQKCFEGQTLQQVLEGITFWFTVDGVSRAETHQHVRTRFAAIMQHGGRDNDWRHRPWRMPETIRRAIQFQNEDARAGDPGYEPPRVKDNEIDDMEHDIGQNLRHCIVKPERLRHHDNRPLDVRIIEGIRMMKELYADLVDAGIPWQDARRVLPIGCTTYLHAIYNFASLKGVLANRLEHCMDWEINAVAQLMHREIYIHCPTWMGDALGSHSDLKGKAAFAGLDSWPPDGKYPAMYDPKERTHRREQMPFFVLTDEALRGGPVEWIRTNGMHPNNRAQEFVEEEE